MQEQAQGARMENERRSFYRRFNLFIVLAAAVIGTHCAHKSKEEKTAPPSSAAADAEATPQAAPQAGAPTSAQPGTAPSVAPSAQATAGQPAPAAVDPKANEWLRRMSQYLAKLPAASTTTNHSTEVVLESGEKLSVEGDSQVSFQRPNKLRSDRKGEIADVSLYYDGKTMSIFDKGSNYYATTSAPPNLDAAIDFARQRLSAEAPAADLIYSDPYKVLTEDVVSGMYVGKDMINGVEAHHLAFRGNETDWQIWITDDESRPLPLKYVITSKKVDQAPEFVVEFRKWETPRKLPEQLFSFVPPKGSERISFIRDVASK